MCIFFFFFLISVGVYSLFMLSFSSCDCEVVWKTKIEDLCNNLALKFCANTWKNISSIIKLWLLASLIDRLIVLFYFYLSFYIIFCFSVDFFVLASKPWRPISYPSSRLKNVKQQIIITRNFPLLVTKNNKKIPEENTPKYKNPKDVVAPSRYSISRWLHW